MKLTAILASLLLTVFSGHTLAACGDGLTRIAGTGNALQNFLRTKQVCATRGSDKWQEFHASNGALIDYKKGANDPVDPTKQVGTWSASNGANAVVTYTYGSTSYSYALYRSGAAGPYTFCGTSPAGNDITGATFQGQGACP